MFNSKYGNQGFLAQRRSNFQGNQFPLATEVARKAPAAPLRNRAFGRNRMANWNKARYFFPQFYLFFYIAIINTEHSGCEDLNLNSSVDNNHLPSNGII